MHTERAPTCHYHPLKPCPAPQFSDVRGGSCTRLHMSHTSLRFSYLFLACIVNTFPK